MTRRDPKAIAAAVREAGVPDNLNRWLGMTPEAAEAYEAKLKRSTRRARDPFIKNPPSHSSRRSSGLGVPPAFLKRTGAAPAAQPKGDDTMKKIKAAATRKTAKTLTAKQRGKSANTSIARAVKADARARKTGRQDEVVTFITGKGATAKAIGAEFELLEHSVRALISGLKKPVKDGGRGLAVKSAKNGDGATVYSIAG